jgi:hypothetical protein
MQAMTTTLTCTSTGWRRGVSGLTAGTTYFFRVQVLTMTGEGDWSQIVSLLVK